MDALKVKPTPTPWTLNGNTAWSDSAKDRGELFRCDMRTGTHIPLEQNSTNAAFIVRAVNAHQALLEAAKHALSKLELLRVEKGAKVETQKAMLEAAISKAEVR